MIVLAGDIGGTKTWLQIADYSSVSLLGNVSIKDNFSVLFERRYVSSQYASFDILLQDFLQAATAENHPAAEQACIGVAGPVRKDSAGIAEATVTNLPWKLNAYELAEQHKFRHIHLINDFQAIAFGLEMLDIDDSLILQEGHSVDSLRTSPKVVIGAGTGLGQALLVWSGGEIDGHYEVIASEGGHGDFAPGSEEQQELMSFLVKQQSRVSVEDVLSGRGLVNVYYYLSNKFPEAVSQSLIKEMLEGDAAAAISKVGMLNVESLAGQALKLFVAIYGTQAGNFALSSMATGGVYIAGGIAAKIKDCFLKDTFLMAFHNKGPMQDVMKTIPVKLVLDSQVGLKGAALVASRL